MSELTREDAEEIIELAKIWVNAMYWYTLAESHTVQKNEWYSKIGNAELEFNKKIQSFIRIKDE